MAKKTKVKKDKKQKKFITTIVLETAFDPNEFGLVQLTMDITSGGTVCLSRKTKKV